MTVLALLIVLCSVVVSVPEAVEAEARTVVVPDDYATIQEAVDKPVYPINLTRIAFAECNLFSLWV